MCEVSCGMIRVRRAGAARRARRDRAWWRGDRVASRPPSWSTPSRVLHLGGRSPRRPVVALPAWRVPRPPTPVGRPRPHCAHNKRLYGFIIYRSPRTPQARPLHLFGLLSRAGCTKTYPRVFTPESRTISHGPDLEQNEHRGARTTPVSTAPSRPSYARRYGALGLR